MKKKVGELFGMPIVIGDPNLVTINEYHLVKEGKIFTLSKRGADGKLHAVTPEADADVAALILDDENQGILDA